MRRRSEVIQKPQNEINGYSFKTGGGGAGPTLTSVDITAGGTTGTVSMPNLFQVLSITTTEPGRFRLYRDTASRDADLARPVTQEVEAGHGLLLEFVTVPGQLAWGLSPLAAGAPATPGTACAWAWSGLTGATITLGIYQEA